MCHSSSRSLTTSNEIVGWKSDGRSEEALVREQSTGLCRTISADCYFLLHNQNFPQLCTFLRRFPPDGQHRRSTTSKSIIRSALQTQTTPYCTRVITCYDAAARVKNLQSRTVIMSDGEDLMCIVLLFSRTIVLSLR